MNYSVNREILDEEAVDEMAEKSESNPSLCEKVKKSLRYSLLYIQLDIKPLPSEYIFHSTHPNMH